VGIESRVQTVCLVILTAIGVAGSVYYLRPVLIPFVLAVFISLSLSTIVEVLVQRLRVPRSLSLLATLALGGLAFLLIGGVISASVTQLRNNSGIYLRQLAQLIEQVRGLLPSEAAEHLDKWNIETLAAIPRSVIGTMLGATSSAILDILSQSLIVLVFVAFLMIGGDWSKPGAGIWGEIQARVRHYLVVTAALSALTGGLVWASLALLGVPLAMAFGFFSFLLNFIPSIGSVIAVILPLPVVLMTPDISSTSAVLAIAIPCLIQFGIGNGLAPKVLGDALDLHPVVILLALIFWGTLWGVIGMLLATPITASLKILLSKLDSTHAVAEIMAGRLDALR
jgi:AI-2 transport protein TqsA